MASSIHHGPPGSFKSFTLVQRSAIDALKAGRVVVTNIRGLTSLERILDQFPDYVFPASAGLIHINTEIALGRRVMAGWFHWVPFGVLILMDEGQRIYPDRNDFKLEKLDVAISPANYEITDIKVEMLDDYTGESYEIGRPEDVFTAFDMQRHYQWDIFISTTHINKIKSPIREASQTAYRHKSLSGKLPLLFKNTWYEFQHDPSNTGQAVSQQIGKPRKYTADTRIFKCYQSTVTGEHTESKADQSILGDGGVRFKLAAIVLSIGTSVYFLFHFAGAHKAIKVDSNPPISSPQVNPGQSMQNNPVRTVSTGQPVTDSLPVQSVDNFTGHLGFTLLSIAHHNFSDKAFKRLSFNADTVDGLKDVSFEELSRQGYRVIANSVCDLTLISPNAHTKQITCDSPQIYGCKALLKTATTIIQHYCSKYGELKEKTASSTPNALASVASSVLGSGGQ
ncbi:MAG: zonular occludens toxin domain-containing protein [Methylobacter sp.]|nr:zonular occludens toxin domain-containing protein [Methylobacter sp.]